jgi:hypothetical protein
MHYEDSGNWWNRIGGKLSAFETVYISQMLVAGFEKRGCRE